MTGWRAAAIVGNADAIESYWRLKSNIDSGMFDAVQLAAVAALELPDIPRETSAIYQRRRDLVCDALAAIGVDVAPPKATIYIWAPVPEGHTSASYCELVLEESGVVLSPGGAYGPNGEVVVIYPEGTVTTRPDGLPMGGKTGAVRLSLATGVPITPMASWGSAAVWQKSGPGSLKPRRPIWVKVGALIGPS